MSDMLNYYHMQPVTDAELDLGFELLEQADHNFASDIGVYGIISGGKPVQHTPVPDLSIDLTAPCRAYDHLGQRIFIGTDQRVDCSIDSSGIPTIVHTAANERWLAVFLKFSRLESDPRTDGNSQQVFFRRDESFQIIVRQGPEADEGAAPKVPLEQDALLVCDVLRKAGQTQIHDVDIDLSRRQNFIFAEADAVEIISGAWRAIDPSANTAQSALDSVDELLGDHIGGTGGRHTAEEIDSTPAGFVTANNVQGALSSIVQSLMSAIPDNAGAALIGSNGEGGAPHALTSGNVRTQLGQLLAWINSHLNTPTGAHNAAAIATAAHSFLTSPSVQGQLQQFVEALASQNSTPGAVRIGNSAIEKSSVQVGAGNVSEQLDSMAGHLNTHLNAGNHDGRYYTKNESDGHFYNVGETVGNSERLNNQLASAFAQEGHEHDSDYLHIVGIYYGNLTSNQETTLATIDIAAEAISLFVRVVNYTGIKPEIYFSGPTIKDLVVWLIENSGGTYDVKIGNQSQYTVNFGLVLYGRDGNAP